MTDYDVQLALGRVPRQTLVSKYGLSAPIASTSEAETVWQTGGLYTGFPDSVEDVEIQSTDSNDTLGGSGARTVIISGLCSGGSAQTWEQPLDGTNWITVESPLGWSRINRMFVRQVGASGTNVGTITARQVVTTDNVFGQITAGIGQTRIAAYTVPAGYIAIARRFFGSVQRVGSGAGVREAEIDFRFREYDDDLGYLAWRYGRDLEISDSAAADTTFVGGVPIGPRTDIDMRVLSASNTGIQVAGGFALVLWRLGG